MRQCLFIAALTICTSILATTSPTRANDDVQSLMRIIPGDLPLTAIVVNFVQIDESVRDLAKRIDPESSYEGVLAELESELPVTKWVNFKKPFALGQVEFGDDNSAVIWAYVPDFVKRVKEIEGATETDGLWLVPFGGDDIYVRLHGFIIAASPSKESMARTAKPATSFADAMKDRADVLNGRDVLLRVNADSIRPMAERGLAQATLMAPMLAMMAGQQAGNPAAITGALTSIIDAAGKLVEQLGYVDMTFAVDKESIDVTIATGFNDGVINSYLAKRKSASTPMLMRVDSQPFFLAMGYNLPGADSPFLEWAFGKIISSVPRSAPGNTPDDGSSDMRAALEVSRDLYTKINEASYVMGMTPEGMRITADIAGTDARAIMDLTTKSMTVSKYQLGPGATLESLGTKKVGKVDVEEFSMKFDTSNPKLAAGAMMFGPNAKIALGRVGDRIRFCMGSTANLDRVFAATTSQPLASGEDVAKTLKALPKKRNFVLLLDPAGAIPLFGPMMGMPPTVNVAPGPPIGISVSLSGNPASLNIHVPISAIERIIKAMPKDGPM